ncbi:hypothetical protein SAMN05443247_04680 [Bradyrhizobium erythrophlei]|nr:hypothetical protein SAMN05443247_04680 [Bradyrhizobium erythrophlei]
MTAPILLIFWSHRISFIIVACLTFIVLAVVVFTLPTRVAATVRSSIEIGSAPVGGKQEAFELPENVARRIPSVYVPAALLAMANKGVSPQFLAALQNPSVESIGRSVVIVSTIDPSLEKEAKEFQETTADIVIKELAPRARALREGVAARLDLAKRAADNLEQQIKDDANEIKRVSTLTDDLRGQFEKQRASLAALYQRTGTELQPGESSMVEARIRELHEQISSQTNLIGNLIRERSYLTLDLGKLRSLYNEQSKAVANAQFEKNDFNETHISLPPTLMPGMTMTPRRLSLLLVAFLISLLVAVGTVVLIHNMDLRKH